MEVTSYAGIYTESTSCPVTAVFIKVIEKNFLYTNGLRVEIWSSLIYLLVGYIDL